MKRSGEIKKIGSLFSLYKDRFKAPQRAVIEVVVEVIRDLLSIEIETKKISYNVSTKTLVLNIPSILKQEIKLHQNEIILHLKGRLGENNYPTNLI